MVNNNNRPSKTRSTILFQITALLLIVFVTSSVVSYFFYMRSTNKLVNKSKDKVIETQAEDMSSSFLFITNLLAETTEEKVGIIGIEELVSAIQSKQSIPVQQIINEKIKDLVEEGTLEANMCNVAIPKVEPLVPEPLIIMTSNEKYMYTEVPETVKKYLTGKGGHVLLEKGIPEWGLEGEQLLVVDLQRAEKLKGFGVWAIIVRSMHDDISAINKFYSDQKRDVDKMMTIVILSTIAVLVLLMFIVLSFLIRRKITRPIDELADVAEHVMEGDLDVKVDVREGEEFENLKVAFNNMVETIRDMITRSTGG